MSKLKKVILITVIAIDLLLVAILLMSKAYSRYIASISGNTTEQVAEAILVLSRNTFTLEGMQPRRYKKI